MHEKMFLKKLDSIKLLQKLLNKPKKFKSEVLCVSNHISHQMSSSMCHINCVNRRSKYWENYVVSVYSMFYIVYNVKLQWLLNRKLRHSSYSAMVYSSILAQTVLFSNHTFAYIFNHFKHSVISVLNTVMLAYLKNLYMS